MLGLHVDSNDVVTIAGYTESNFTTTPGAFASARVGDMEAFVARIDPSLSGQAQLTYSTYLGGTERDRGQALSVNENGIIAVAGDTSSIDFPVTSDAFNPSYRLDDIFVACLDITLTGPAQLTYSTFAGGSELETPRGLHIDARGIVTFIGQTESVDYPTSVGSLNQFYQGGAEDGFVSQLDPNKTGRAQLVYSSFIGGNNRDHVLALDVHESGLIAISGWTWSSDFVTTKGAWDRGLGGFSDSFVSLIAPFPIGSAQLVYSTLFGGSGHEQAHAIAIHSNLVITVGGETRSLDFPTTAGAIASSLVGTGATPPADCWIARFDGTQSSTTNWSTRRCSAATPPTPCRQWR